jgi:hypothetical protein
MASEQASGKQGLQPIGGLLRGVLRPAFKGRAAATAQVLADWEAIVGPALAAITLPKRLSAGTLTIGCGGPVAMELQHLSVELIGRVNAYLGHAAVIRLRFVQATARPRPAAARAAPPPALAAARHAAARHAVAALPQGELRDALERLGRVVLAQTSPLPDAGGEG